MKKLIFLTLVLILLLLGSCAGLTGPMTVIPVYDASGNLTGVIINPTDTVVVATIPVITQAPTQAAQTSEGIPVATLSTGAKVYTYEALVNKETTMEDSGPWIPVVGSYTPASYLPFGWYVYSGTYWAEGGPGWRIGTGLPPDWILSSFSLMANGTCGLSYLLTGEGSGGQFAEDGSRLVFEYACFSPSVIRVQHPVKKFTYTWDPICKVLTLDGNLPYTYIGPKP